MTITDLQAAYAAARRDESRAENELLEAQKRAAGAAAELAAAIADAEVDRWLDGAEEARRDAADDADDIHAGREARA